jgi:hypothetical protein
LADEELFDCFHDEGVVIGLGQSGDGDRADDPTSRIRTGNEPPCAAYCAGSTPWPSSSARPFALNRRPTRYEAALKRSTTRTLRSIHASLSGVVPGSAAWKS